MNKRQKLYRKRQNVWRNNVPKSFNFGKALNLETLKSWYEGKFTMKYLMKKYAAAKKANKKPA